MQRLHSTPGPAGDGHAQVTSTAAADIHTVASPLGARSLMIACGTTDCRVTLDGQAPSAGVGLTIRNGQQPIYLPVTGSALQVASTATANSVVDILWLF